MTFRLDERYRVEGAERIDSPALLVFPEIIKTNIARAVELCRTPEGNCLRPHIKTVKCREIAELAIAQGVTRFKCSTVSEGELLAAAGATEVLLAYQLSRVKAERWGKLRTLYPATRFASIVDNVASARVLTEVLAGPGVEVYIDLNVGMNRTGIAPAHAPTLLDELNVMPELTVRGLHAYDGHLHQPNEQERGGQAARIYQEVDALRQQLETHHDTSYELVVGGSPTFTYYAGKPNTTVGPGTFYLWDAGYARDFPELPFEPAALLLMRIVSVVDATTLCFDLGSKAVSPDSPLPRVVIPTLADYTVTGQHEEHLNVRVPDTSRHAVGEVHYGIPVHVCPTVNLYSDLLPVTGGRVGEPWTVAARDRRITV